jgi:hypothetical protein
MLVAWPWAQQHPLTRPLTAAAEAAHFDWAGILLFRGEMMSASELPRSYLPTWFALSMPEFYLLALVAGVASLFWLGRSGRRVRSERARALAVLVAFVAAPVLGVLVTHPVLYDAQRHFLFLWPPMAALGGVAFAHVLSEAAWPRALRSAIAALWLLLSAAVLADMVELHPYEYIYFNRSSGGLSAQVARYETDYWGATYREGLAWISRELPADGARLSLSGCWDSERILSYYLRTWPGMSERFYYSSYQDARADIYIATTRYDCHKTRGRLVHTVDRQGAALLYVYRRERERPKRQGPVGGRQSL